MFENKSEPLASRRVFIARVIRFFLIAFGAVFVWLGVGALGYHYLAALSWEDALYNSALIVSDMGPAFPFSTTAAKLFTAVYALASGLVFIACVGIAFAPIIHRFLHVLHVDRGEA
jgi:hypothetical protein